MKPAVLLGMIRGADRIASALLGRASLEIIALYEPGSRVLASAGIAHRRLDDYSSETHRAVVFASAEQRAQRIANEIYTEGFRARWPQFDPATWSALRDQLMLFLKRDLIEEMFVVDTVRRCAHNTDLRLVVVPEDYGRDSRAAILSAQRLGIPALHLLHGYPYQTQNAHDIVSANVTAVFSSHCKGIVESFGASPERVVVTGNPAWDVYATAPAPGLKRDVCARLGLDPNRPIIEYAMTGVHRFSAISQKHPRYHLDIAEAVIDAFGALGRSHPDWQFILRPHPIEPIAGEFFEECATRAGLAKLFVDMVTSEEILSAVDVLLCTHSNIGIEAILRGLPVVNVALEEFGGPVFREGIGPLFLEGDAVVSVRQASEIAPAVQGALLDSAVRSRLADQRPATVERLNFANDGKAAERFCTLALDMISRNSAYVAPCDRYPELESAFVQAMPPGANRVLVAGHAARRTAQALESVVSPDAIQIALALDPGAAPCDVLVISDPLPHSSRAVECLVWAKSLVGDSGSVIAAFRHGGSRDALRAFQDGTWAPPRPHGEAPSDTGQYSSTGVDMVLSRSDLEATHRVAVRGPEVSAEPVGGAGNEDALVDGWVICTRPRVKRLSPFAAERQERKRKADLSNRIGERRFAKGDIRGAAVAFAEAIKHWNEDAVYFSNLATALFSAHQADNAWHRIQEALYLDPFHQVTRANYRMIANALGKLDEAEKTLSLFGADE